MMIAMYIIAHHTSACQSFRKFDPASSTRCLSAGDRIGRAWCERAVSTRHRPARAEADSTMR
eukprot:579134-Rhodomonas_salina.3